MSDKDDTDDDDDRENLFADITPIGEGEPKEGIEKSPNPFADVEPIEGEEDEEE